MKRKRLLFVGSGPELRCSAAARLFSTEPGIQVDWCSLASRAVHPLDEKRLDWADIIFVMDEGGGRRLRRRHRERLARKQVVDLGLPPGGDHLDLRLLEMLRCRVRPHLSRS